MLAHSCFTPEICARSPHGAFMASPCLRRTPLRLPQLWVLLGLLGLACGSPSRKLMTSVESTLSGTSIVIDEHGIGQRDSSLLAVQTPDGRRVVVQLEDPSHLAGLTTGQPVELTGVWEGSELLLVGSPQGRTSSTSTSTSTSSMDVVQSAQAQGSQHKHKPSPPQFKARRIKFSRRPVTLPRVTRVPAGKQAGNSKHSGSTGSSGNLSSRGSADVVTAAETATAASITLSTNTLVSEEVPTIFIPIAAVDPVTGANCPGIGSPLLGTAALRMLVFQELNPTAYTVGSTFNDCSYNKTRLNSTNSRVANLVRLPCSGITNGVSWSFGRCSFNDYSGWGDAADAVIRSRGTSLTPYEHRMYLLPPGACGDPVGWGYVGCDSTTTDCRSWIGGNYWDKPQAMVHELAHNLWMNHANRLLPDGSIEDYGDRTGVMGYCCEDRCWNTPHAWQAGWITVQQLDGTTLRAGQTVQVSLASQSTTARSGLRIVPTWSSTAEPVFLGFRTQAGGDEVLSDAFANKVHVHTSRLAGTLDAATTVFRTTLDVAGAAWTYNAASLVVRVKGFPRGLAVVTVCRRGGAETATTCAAGIDNDCNGLAGAADPACAKF